MNAKRSGSTMTRETFLAACEFAENYGGTITLGGGEPTLHPLLFDFVGLALAHDEESGCGVCIITNGGRTKIALRLADMARRGILMAELSIDQWHDPIDPKVVEAFTKNPADHYLQNERTNRDLRGIRTVEAPFRRGRWKKGEDRCACPDLTVEPNGDLFHCGCRRLQYGTIFNPEIPRDSDSYESGTCSEPANYDHTQLINA